MTNASWDIRTFSPMKFVAVLAAIALVGTLIWRTTSSWNNASLSTTNVQVSPWNSDEIFEESIDWQREFTSAPTDEMGDENLDTPENSDGISNIAVNVMSTIVGAYSVMKDSGLYTPSSGEGIGSAIATDLRASVSHKTYAAADLRTDAGTSTSRILSYRNDLRIALESLLKNSAYELETFAYYLDSKDPVYLEDLRRAAENYRLAQENVILVVVPEGAVSYHLDILNALSEFEAVLGHITEHADDPFAAAALLRTFGNSETHMLTSFDALAGYFKHHTGS